MVKYRKLNFSYQYIRMEKKDCSTKMFESLITIVISTPSYSYIKLVE